MERADEQRLILFGEACVHILYEEKGISPASDAQSKTIKYFLLMQLYDGVDGRQEVKVCLKWYFFRPNL
jgi:hypothetical protein